MAQPSLSAERAVAAPDTMSSVSSRNAVARLAALGQLVSEPVTSLLMPNGGPSAPRPWSEARGFLEQAVERALRVTLVWSFPLFLLVVAVWPWHPVYGYAWDFRVLYEAGAHYLNLQSPYVTPSLANLTSRQNFVYPAPMAALFAPLSLLPYPVAAVLFIAASAALLGLALWILGLRDWRCYAAAYLSFPGQLGLKLGTISPLLVFLLAVLWRYRNRSAVVGPALALAVVSKLFLWPVALWFLFTRRIRGFVAAVVLSGISVITASAPIGLGSLLGYPRLVHELSRFEAPQSISTYALLYGLGLSATAALVGAVCLGLALLALAYRWARADEGRAFRATVLASLILSPIVWNHYLCVLFVPLALWRPRFSPLWFSLAWVEYDGFAAGRTFFIAATAVTLALMVVQAGVVDFNGVRRVSGATVRLRLGEPETMVALWPLFLAMSASISGAVLVAALRPESARSAASGTAVVRVVGAKRVCWRVWTSGIAATASVSLVSNETDRVLASGMLSHDTRDETCATVRPASRAELTRVSQRGSAGLELRVASGDGRALLSGLLLPRVDAGRAVAPSATAPR